MTCNIELCTKFMSKCPINIVEEWCQSMKKMDQKMKRACKKIPATSD